jgi:glycosyltransferase involved in cell wall biosynthesis
MRVLFLSTSMGMGGADQQLLSAAREMRLQGYAVLVVSLTPLGPMGIEARGLGIPVESLEMRRGVPDPRGLVRLVRLVRKWKPDVVHSHMVHANLMARVLRLFVRVPVLVSTIHNIHEGGRLRMAAYRLTNGLVDHMTIVSEAAADRFVSEGIVPRKLLCVIPNGIDTTRFRNVPAGTRESIRRSLGLEHEFVWLAVGRFVLAKDYPNLLHAFARVHNQYPEAVLLLVGRGALQGETEALVQALGLGPRVRFLGVRQDVPDLMSAADGYVMSSEFEGMPIVLLEAAAAGLPIVATSVGGNAEVVQHEESGILVPARDHEALAVAMLRILGMSAADRRAMGEQGHEHIRTHYGLGRVVERWDALYRELLLRKGLRVAPIAAPGRSGAGQLDSRRPSATA